ncbi:MAG: alpha-amylase family glycosyl hydrolase, partial [Proteobacteria bacterium]|nr:alpha-amylase family glycosyl hydrolase [Pseudomonadota bacterium]
MMAQLPSMEFHISRKARDLYQFDGSLFSLSGNVILANFHAARVFAQKMNQKRDLVNFSERAVKPGQINAMGLIDEILHYMVGLYREQINKDVIHQALIQLNKALGKEEVDKSLRNFLDEFPPVKVYRQEITIETYLNSETANIPNRQIILEEMLLLWLANMNPAFSPFIELFDDTVLKKNTVYLQIISGLRRFFETQPSFGPYNQSLVDMLRSPAVIVPYSLSGQLEYIRTHWKLLLRKYLYRLLKSLDLFKEEEKVTFMGPGLAEVYKYIGLELELELFSPDRDWMPRLVLMAKNVYVWLDQLSKKYSLSITRLDQIPDEELDMLGQQGFSGLWLIGIWERSPASQKIKQLCGNPEAVPSAYSLFDYTISEDLGGEEAYQSLKNRAWQRGIRLASDMVPNHVGIYSRWMIEHPDWFVSLNYNPFPWYIFGGPNLSHDERVAIYIEDHYYNRTDASVVCKRVDSWTGSEKFIYHGNDGTSMPWNDTAQLNYLNPEVRETMIQTILHVARKFPIIRFDAAMTLTKKHYQRLWFPEPGTGGAIPTRAEFGLTKDEFNKLMPKEFWREVVDRVAAEAPDTLLLAEAFWLLEGYFVRTLGMHRVYNSAFMNMLRDEDNAKYRTVMKNTLEFDPEILRRFVNFMNNPDEQTAVEQFEKGDKYFGTCTMMVTMPGLPMFGHGQIEGFEEKYGMEYRRAYKDEKPDT